MLIDLTVNNFAIVENLELELASGMTVISGETGAGKSIMLDALGLAMGGRAETGAVRHGAERAEIIASFDLTKIAEARQWLTEQDLEQDGECIVRRTITAEGRSRSSINGRPCTLAALRELGQHLVAIHGQHEHQKLMLREHHCQLLDEFAGLERSVLKTAQSYREFRNLQRRFLQLSEQSEEQQAKVQLLSYQVEELDQLALQSGEIEQLEQQQVELSQAGQILHTGHGVLGMLSEGEQQHCQSQLNHALAQLAELPESPALQQAHELLNGALIQLEEGSHELRHYLDRVEIDPQTLMQVEERLSAIYDLARKHRLLPDQLLEFHQQQRAELDALTGSGQSLDELEQATAAAKQAYLEQAQKLAAKRRSAGAKLARQINQQLADLGMPNARFEVAFSELNEQRYGANGIEEPEFVISTNIGQPAKPLGKVASGGELSRISLAIQVVTAQTSSTPTLIFDEVDVGIGGAIAEVVGRLLRQLGERAQILCVTHQPQVASQGHQHLYVSKRAGKKTTHTQITRLDESARVQEVARMLGGITITERSLDHAREMLGTGINYH